MAVSAHRPPSLHRFLCQASQIHIAARAASKTRPVSSTSSAKWSSSMRLFVQFQQHPANFDLIAIHRKR